MCNCKIVKEKRKRIDLECRRMAGWHHQCNEHELGQTLGDGEGKGGLACYSPCRSQSVEHNWATEQQQRMG